MAGVLFIITDVARRRHLGRAKVQPYAPPNKGRHSCNIFMRRPSGASPPICWNDSAAGSGLLNNGCQSSKERFKITFQFPFLPSSSVLTSALFPRADVCFRPWVFRWVDVFKREAFCSFERTRALLPGRLSATD